MAGGRPTLLAIAGSRNLQQQKLERLERMVAQARATGNMPKHTTCIRTAIVFNRRLSKRDDSMFIANDPVEQAALDTLVARFIEDVAYVVENISPHAGTELLNYVDDLFFRRAQEDGTPSIALYLGRECLVKVSGCKVS